MQGLNHLDYARHLVDQRLTQTSSGRPTDAMRTSIAMSVRGAAGRILITIGERIMGAAGQQHRSRAGLSAGPQKTLDLNLR